MIISPFGEKTGLYAHPSDEPHGRAAVHRDLEQPRRRRVAAGSDDPGAIWRPVSRALSHDAMDLDGRSQGPRVGAVCRHDGELSFPELPDDDRDTAAIGRHHGRLGQHVVGALRYLERLAVVKPPEPVTGPSGREREVEQRRSTMARCEGAFGRYSVGLRIDILDAAIVQRDAPEAGRGFRHGRDDATAVPARRHGRVLLEPHGHSTRHLALDVEGPQPRPRPVFRARHIEQRAQIERRQKIHVGVLGGELLRRRA